MKVMYGFKTKEEAEDYAKRNHYDYEIKETCQGRFKIISHKNPLKASYSH